MHNHYELIDGRVTPCTGDREGIITVYSAPTEEEKLFLNPDLSRDDICEMFDVDKNKIGQIIKAYSGSNNLSAYLNRKRVQYAVLQMRKHPNWKIPAIAESCGIPSISSFNRVFKQVFGMSPTDFAQQDLS